MKRFLQLPEGVRNGNLREGETLTRPLRSTSATKNVKGRKKKREKKGKKRERFSVVAFYFYHMDECLL